MLFLPLYGVVLPSRHSTQLETILAKEIGLNLANVSRSLAELEKKGLISCLTPKQKVGRLYSLTKKGKDVAVKMEKMEESS